MKSLQEAIDIYFHHLKANGRTAACRSYKPYYKNFTSFMNGLQRETIESVTEGDWYKYAEYLETRYKTNSRAYCINAVKPFFKYWNKRNHSSVLPDTIITQRYKEVQRDTLDEDEYRTLLEVSNQDSIISMRDNLIFRILAETGIRVSELVALNIEDLGTGQDCIVQIRSRKNDELGYLMWTKETNDVLHKWLGYRLCYPGQAVFISCSNATFGNRLTTRSIERIFQEYVPHVTEKKITPHCMRHLKAHSLLKGGASSEEFNLLLHHKNWSSRFKYLRLSKDEFMQMANKYLVQK